MAAAAVVAVAVVDGGAESRLVGEAVEPDSGEGAADPSELEPDEGVISICCGAGASANGQPLST